MRQKPATTLWIRNRFGKNLLDNKYNKIIDHNGLELEVVSGKITNIVEAPWR